MVRLFSVLELHVEIASQGITEGARELLDQDQVEITNEQTGGCDLVNEAGAAAQVQNNPRKRLSCVPFTATRAYTPR